LSIFFLIFVPFFLLRIFPCSRFNGLSYLFTQLIRGNFGTFEELKSHIPVHVEMYAEASTLVNIYMFFASVPL
jgi:hypothetical protein